MSEGEMMPTQPTETLEQAIAGLAARGQLRGRKDELTALLRGHVDDCTIALELASVIIALPKQVSLWECLIQMLSKFGHKFVDCVQHEMDQLGCGFHGHDETNLIGQATTAALQRYAGIFEKLRDLRSCECNEIRALLDEWGIFVDAAYLQFRHESHDPVSRVTLSAAEPFFDTLRAA
jgi:hypothetical protein